MEIVRSSARWHSVGYGHVVRQTTERIRRKSCNVISQLGNQNNTLFKTGILVHVVLCDCCVKWLGGRRIMNAVENATSFLSCAMDRSRNRNDCSINNRASLWLQGTWKQTFRIDVETRTANLARDPMIDTFSIHGQHEVASKFLFRISASTLDSWIFLEF